MGFSGPRGALETAFNTFTRVRIVGEGGMGKGQVAGGATLVMALSPLMRQLQLDFGVKYMRAMQNFHPHRSFWYVAGALVPFF